MSCTYRICFFLILIWNLPSLAAIDVNLVEIYNASRVVKPAPTQSTPGSGAVTPSGNIKVYGGLAGSATAGDCAGATTTCNNCVGDNQPCNANRISPDALLRFEFQTNNAEAVTANSALFLTHDSNTKINPTNASTFLGTNTPLFIEIRWGDLCAAVGAGVGCINGLDSVKTIQVGISSSSGDSTLDEYFAIDLYIVGSSTGTQYFSVCPTEQSTTESDGGYCYFEVQRGDEKVYISNEIHGANFNRAPGGVKYQYLRVFYGESDLACADANFATVVTSASPYKDLTFSEQNGKFILDDPTVTGLTNGKTYYFRIANVDEAGNVFYFSGDKSPGVPAASQLLDANVHCKVPSEVVGLLDGEECFIATAAYGSSVAPQLPILREFRDKFLKTNKVGRWLVTQYYSYSPKWAQKIKKRPVAKAVVRATLSPIVSMAQWVVLYGLKYFILLSGIGFCLGFFVVRRLIRDDD